jgi:NhaP-type Na+/H+ or K+/H+ antiporter
VWSRHVIDVEQMLIILLPPLIFESSFKMSAFSFTSNFTNIALTTIIAYLLTVVVQALATFYLFFDVNFTWSRVSNDTRSCTLEQSFLYAAMVGGTDPVAVIALLEEIGAPLSMRAIIEGESMLNDGLALVFFRICVLWCVATHL